MKQGLVFDIEYCTGCMACTVACRQEHGFDENTWGIKVTEHVYTRPDGRVQVDYLPFPTLQCSLCAERIKSGFDTRPSCVKHCPSACIEYGNEDMLLDKSKTLKRPVIYLLVRS